MRSKGIYSCEVLKTVPSIQQVLNKLAVITIPCRSPGLANATCAVLGKLFNISLIKLWAIQQCSHIGAIDNLGQVTPLCGCWSCASFR